MTRTQSQLPLDEVLPVQELKRTASGPVEGIVLPEIGGLPSAPFKASRWTLACGAWSDWDQHAVLEIWLVSAGAGSVWREDVETPVSDGDVVLMPSRVRHRLHNPGPTPMSLFSVWWPAPSEGPAEDADDE